MNLSQAIAVWNRNPSEFTIDSCADGVHFGLLPAVGSVVCVVDHELASVVMRWVKESELGLSFCGMRSTKRPEYYFEVIADPLEEQWSMAAYERCV